MPEHPDHRAGAARGSDARTSGSLAPCPETRNCISSLASSEDREHHLPPLPYRGGRAASERRLRAALAGERRLTRRAGSPADHWHLEARSLVFRFVDDVEFHFDDAARLIHFRSASRVGQGDFGVNRRRMRRIGDRYRRAI